MRKRHTAVLYGSRRMAGFSSSFPGFLQVLVDKFLIKCVTHEGFVEKVVNDRKYVFHFRPKPNIWPEKHLALGQIPKLKPNVPIFVKIGGFCCSAMFLMSFVNKFFLQFW